MSRAVRILLLVAGLLAPLVWMGLPPPAAAVAPDITIWKTVDASVTDPGRSLTYTIYLNNPGPQAALRAWVNDTLPPGVQYRGSSVSTDIGSPPFMNEVIAGQTVSWQFSNYPANGNRSFRVFATVGPNVADGQVLTNVVSLWYTNVTGVPQAVRTATASTTVSIPVILASKAGYFASFNQITYTVTVANTGSGAAGNLWWNDTLPAGVQYVVGSVRSASGPLGVVCTSPAQRLECTVRNPVLPFVTGSKTWLFDANIPTPLAPGTLLANVVFVNYTDVDGTHMGQVRAWGNLTVQTADIQVAKIANTAAVPPGGLITYTIFYTNRGQMPAGTVWVNDTLPVDAGSPAATVVSAVPNATLTTSRSVLWLFTNVPTGNHSLLLTVRTLASLGEGTVLVNSVALNYTNADGQGRPGSTSSASTTISLDVPSIEGRLVASPPTVAPGGSVSYTLYYNNSRPALAAYVDVEVFLPPSLPLVDANPSYTSTGPGKYIWNLTNIGSGPHTITLAVTVPSSSAAGATFRVTAFVNYTDDHGVRIGGSQTSATVTVVEPSSLLPLILAAAAIAAVIVVIVLVLRVRAASASTVIEEVFLLHRDGLLIKHYTRRLKPDVDSDVLSGMLIAVQNFVNESFIGEAGLKREGLLDEMKFGQYRILLTRGKYVIVAAVVAGARMERVPAEMRAATDDLEAALGPVLDSWEGDMDKVADADRFMQDLIAGKYRGRIARPRGNR